MFFNENEGKALRFIIIIFNILTLYLTIHEKENEIKVALCTMGMQENLYINEFIDYYIKLGIDHIFLYDDNEPGTEKFSEAINKKYKNFLSILDNKILHIKNQADAFNDCYKKNYIEFDWFIMVDMDEFVYIVNNTLKEYLKNKIFNKCDFIKLHWVIPTDNDLIHYDPRPLFERFKPPYINSKQVKSIIRGNIPDLKYWIHSPLFSPKKNTSCNNKGDLIYSEKIYIKYIKQINIDKAYLIHFRFKSTEELVNKIKRGLRNWFKNNTNKVLRNKVKSYLRINKITLEKLNFIEKELKINLSKYKKKLNFKK